MKRTQMRSYYTALLALKQQEWDALAQLHARDAARLGARIRHDLQTVSGYRSLVDVPFSSTPRKRLPEPPDPTEIRTTPEFAAALGREWHQVAGHPELRFRYVAHEVSALRTGETGDEPRWLDLLLVNDDDTPILTELKIATDKLPYFAFIQLLMHAVELSSENQRIRMRKHLGLPEAQGDNARTDLYVIGYGEPNVTYHGSSATAVESIAKQLLQGKTAVLSAEVRRIVYLQAVPSGGALGFHAEFVVECH
jgi:hypothetical protein